MLVGGAVADKPARLVSASEPVTVATAQAAYVSRGGQKLQAALAGFGVCCKNKRCIDIGASTGGFTDCLLQAGADTVVAVDVGRGQLHERLERDPRVTSVPNYNFRHADVVGLGAPFDLAVVDVSFISLRILAGNIRSAVGNEGEVIALIKPQFESGRAAVSAGGGIIDDPELWRESIMGVLEAFGAVGLGATRVMASPLLGAKGNAEFLCHLRPHGTADLDQEIEGTLAQALALGGPRRTRA